jgi:hypothetical protein
VSIVGRGPSSGAKCDGTIIGINTRLDTPYHRYPDAIFAVDDEPYRRRFYKAPVTIAPIIKWHHPPCLIRGGDHTDNQTRFYVADDGLVYCLCLSGIQAIFLALTRTKADVVLTGFDLSDWAIAQLGTWSVALRLIAREPEYAARLHRHRDMTGPLSEMVTAW